MAKPKIFISYRRQDPLAMGSVGRIWDYLVKACGRNRVIMDVQDMRGGQNFHQVLLTQVQEADVLLVVMGPRWAELMAASLKQDGAGEAPEDWVRLEIETALAAGIPVFPVLLGDAHPPGREHLPENLADLRLIHAPALEPNSRNFPRQMAELLKELELAAKSGRKKPAKPTSPPAPPKPASKPAPARNRNWLLAMAGLGIAAVVFLASRPPAETGKKDESRPPVPVAVVPAPERVPEPPKPVAITPRTATKENPYVNSLGMKFVPVPGTGVLFCVWETRVQDYAAFAKENPSVDMTWKDYAYQGHQQEPDHPVVNVSWAEAQAFCTWLSKREGVICRLPTDHEWSLAVGIGKREDPTASPDKKDMAIKGEYPWGSTWPPPARAGNFSSTETDGYAFTAPVGSFSANNYGIYDLGGNVREWCEDKYGSTDNRVLRGGSWYFSGSDSLLFSVSDSLLSSYRDRGAPASRGSNVGFRVVVVAGSGG